MSEPPSRDGLDIPDHLAVVGEELPEPTEVDDLIVLGAAVVAALGGLLFGVGLLIGLPLWAYGTGLAVGLLGLAVGVRRYFAAAYPDIDAVEPRDLPADDGEEPVGVQRLERRSLLQRVLLAAAGLVGIGLLAPVTSLGPRARGELRRTAWAEGVRLVTGDGTPLRPDDVARGGISTVWPEGAVNVESAAVVLVRLSGAEPAPPTNLDWVVDGELVAYSKVCTHVGCPVGLFRERDDVLFCPCHQSTFDAARGAVPTFGPTARPLPQLPMGTDGDGFLIALGDFQAQVGPAFG